MIQKTDLAGSFTLPSTSMTLNRMGYGAMQLAGPQVWGPPRDVDAAIAVLREAVESGASISGSGIQAKLANRSGLARTSSAENSLQRRAKARALAVSPVCTPGVLSETTATSMPASSMNEMVASLDQRSGASPPTGACAFSVSCQKKSGNMW